MPVLEPINSVAYRLRVGRDTIELGDSVSAQVMGKMKYARNRGTYFKLSHSGTPSGLATVDVPNGIIRIPYGAETVELTSHAPDADCPDGRAEFNVILNSKPLADINNEYWQTLDFEVSGFNMEHVLGLNEEYNQARCVEEWAEDYGTGTYQITPTEIKSPDGLTVLKTKAEHIVHSIEGTAILENRDISVMGKNKNNGGDITWTNLSRDHLSLPRRLLVDKNGKTARIEDIQIVGNQLRFKLPTQFIKTAKYPVQHATGVDPAYTQLMVTYTNTGAPDGTWVDHDTTYNSAVLSIIMANIQAGTENTTGIRANGSGLDYRFLSIHEAEGGGETHARMFVQTDANGIYETYAEDYTDAIWYIVGYWTNVTFIELWNSILSGTTWTDRTLAAGASSVHHVIMGNSQENLAITAGVRANGSSLVRRLLVHEPETGGESILDLFVKADASKVIENYDAGATTNFRDAGYFGSEMDFVELWQQITLTTTAWEAEDLTAYLDQDGRMVDFLLVHSNEGAALYLGARDGDDAAGGDAATERKLLEHEAESAGAGGEYTGFGLSVKSNASGVVNLISSNAGEMLMLAGYFKPAAAGVERGPVYASVLMGILPMSIRDIAIDRDSQTLVGNLISASRGVDAIRLTSTFVGNLVSATKSWGVAKTATVLIGVLATGTRTIAGIRNSLVLIGNLLSASRAATFSRQASTLIGNLVSASRAVDFARIASVLIGNLVIATKSWGRTITSSVLIGNLVFASRLMVATRLSNVSTGILATASRTIDYSRLASVLTGMLVTAFRVRGIVRSASILIGSLVNASRSIDITRMANLAVGNLVSVTKSWGIVIYSTVLVGTLASASRSFGTIRNASIAIGNLVSAFKSWGVTKSASVLIGNLVTASRALVATRLASVAIGNLVSASKSWGVLRTASVLIGTLVGASRALATTRVSNANIGNLVSASRLLSAMRSAAINIGVLPVASRLGAFIRSASLDIGNLVSASVEYVSGGITEYYRYATVVVGVAVSAIRELATIRLSNISTGLLTTASRILAATRLSGIAVGIFVSATRFRGFTRQATALIGNLVSASRALATSREASVIIGIWGTASRLLAATRVALVAIGVYVEAVKIANWIRQTLVSVGNKVSALRLLHAFREGLASIGIAISASKTWWQAHAHYLITAIVSIGVAVSVSYCSLLDTLVRVPLARLGVLRMSKAIMDVSRMAIRHLPIKRRVRRCK